LIDTEREEELTGEEYEESTNVQTELYALFAALKIIAEDRKTIFTGRENFEVKTNINTAVTVVRQAFISGIEDPDPTSRLILEHIKDRDSMRAILPFKSIDGENGIISNLQSAHHSLDWRKSGLIEEKSTNSRLVIEIASIRNHLVHLNEVAKREYENLEQLDKQTNVFRTCMNARLDYYKGLQALSDMVQPYKEHVEELIDRGFLIRQEKEEETGLSGLKVFEDKLRFLRHLKVTASEEKSKECIICRESIEMGVLTICGHQYHQDCLKEWFKQHQSCPVSVVLKPSLTLTPTRFAKKGSHIEIFK